SAPGISGAWPDTCSVQRRRSASSSRAESGIRLLALAAPVDGRSVDALAMGVLFVGADDLLHQGVAYDVGAGEIGERKPAHVGEDAASFDQPAFLTARKVDLGDVAGDNRLG